MKGMPLLGCTPGNADARVSPDSPACPVDGRDVFRALSPRNVVGIVCTIRFPSVFPRVMTEREHSPVVAFAQAGTTGNPTGDARRR